MEVLSAAGLSSLRPDLQHKPQCHSNQMPGLVPCPCAAMKPLHNEAADMPCLVHSHISKAAGSELGLPHSCSPECSKLHDGRVMHQGAPVALLLLPLLLLC